MCIDDFIQIAYYIKLDDKNQEENSDCDLNIESTLNVRKNKKQCNWKMSQ